MTTELDRLIDAVEAGTFAMDVLPPPHEITAYNAFSGSLDAAVTLLEAALPGWNWGRMNDRMFVEQGRSVISARGSNPARALLLAVLRAKLMEESHE